MTRRTLAALLLLPTLLLAGCGGDDGDSDGGSGGSGGSGGGDSSQAGQLEGDPCDVTVTITGAEEADWDGEGVVDVTSSDQVPPATYQAIDGDVSLQASSVGNGFDDPTILLTVGDLSYGVAPGEGTSDIDPEGSGATVDAPAKEFGSGDEVQITAEWTC